MAMILKYRLVVLILLSLVWVSCKNVIDLNLAPSVPQLVIEANITDEVGPQAVLISRTAPVDSPNKFTPVTNASVKFVNNKGNEVTLIQRASGAYYSTSFAGKYNQVYQLKVRADGKDYLAAATMPAKVAIDSIALSVQTFGTKAEKTIIVFYQDTPGVPNYYRFVLTINGVQVKRIFTRDDQFNDGKLVQAYLYEDDIELKSGDRVDIEMQCIEKGIYSYWYTFSQQGNGFTSATPTNPDNNFLQGTPLGYFSVHTTEHRNIIIP